MSRRPSPGSRLRRDVVVFVAGLLAIAAALSVTPSPASAAPARPSAPNYPWSSLDNVAVWGGNVMVAGGWSFDPDTRGTIKIIAAVDVTNTRLALASTGGYRPDAAGVAGGRLNTGFGIAVPGLAPGPHIMCIAAQNVGRGDPWRLFGCRNFTVGNVNPIGSLDTVGSLGDRAVASGWTADPQTPIPNEVRVDVDGQPAARVRAQGVRNDVAAAYPGLGNLHGFSVTVPIGPGAHQVCATGLNLDVGVDVPIGCRSVDGFAVQPSGHLDGVGVVGNRIRATGWAYDPDVGGPSTVVVTDQYSPLVNGASASAVASAPRPDVAAAHRIDPNHGFNADITPTQPGQHTVCVTVINRGSGSDQGLGCATTTVVDRRPQGGLTSVTPMSGGVGATLSGAVSDPDQATAVTLHVKVDGLERTVTTANGAFSIPVAMAAGAHSICVTAIDLAGTAAGLTGDQPFTCGSVFLSTQSGRASIGTTGAPQTLGPVGPASSSPIAGVDRDDGLSVRLHDGSIMWLWGDSSETDLAGNLKYFVSGTAAWSSAGQPRTTTDAVSGGAPVKFATPVSWGAPCNPGEKQVDWPISASVKAQSATQDRVIVFLENVCLGAFGTGSSRGLAVADWIYDSANQPHGQPIVAHILNQQIRTTRSYGQSSFLDPVANLLYAYSCRLPPGTFDLGAYGPCTVSRVSPDQVNDTAAYQYWNGGGWSADVGQAAAMTMPDLIDKSGNDIPVFPVAAFTTRYDVGTGLYVMVYSPWPGFTDQLVVRVATSPTGPWTSPLQVFLPGCHDSIGTNDYLCYAGTGQPQFNVGGLLGSNDSLGIGWYDQLTGLGPQHGAYEAGNVPFSVVKNP